MTDREQIEFTKQKIFELALNIARLQCHSCYVDEEERLVLVSGNDAESYIRTFVQQLEYEAKNVLMRGGWELE